MEIRYDIYENLAVILILCAGIGSCMHGVSSWNEVAQCQSNSGSNKLNLSTSCSMRKYIVKSYFEKYECLVDLNFEEFIAHEMPFSSCEVLPHNHNIIVRPSVLQRHLVGEGSHRRLSSSISFQIKSESISQRPAYQCVAIIVERLPSGIFADPFELQHLHERGDVAVFGDTNLELPSFLSNRSAVEVHMDVGHNVFLAHNNRLDISVEIPLHARYPALDESGYSNIEFGEPDLFMLCSIEAELHNKSCLLVTINNGTESRIGGVVWKIPSGIKAHTELVSIVTFIVAFFSTLLIVTASIFCSDIKQFNLKNA